ncbi:Uu.00g105300.m01.CDS01 [Anthostomella pinea]|uniref:Uu.00g105300.m01.CDS01 n=1 Tax=Anthostomella pinea TaxID=933095 RepID=A0AAI8VDY1_9PEZI|nr:Uu.00g105300.m01.CDS01 [Anthostomella pinea]
MHARTLINRTLLVSALVALTAARPYYPMPYALLASAPQASTTATATVTAGEERRGSESEGSVRLRVGVHDAPNVYTKGRWPAAASPDIRLLSFASPRRRANDKREAWGGKARHVRSWTSKPEVTEEVSLTPAHVGDYYDLRSPNTAMY